MISYLLGPRDKLLQSSELGFMVGRSLTDQKMEFVPNFHKHGSRIL